VLTDVLERARSIQDQSNKRRKRTTNNSGIPTALVLMQFEGGGTSAPAAAERPGAG
jgi:hypothetical protein